MATDPAMNATDQGKIHESVGSYQDNEPKRPPSDPDRSRRMASYWKEQIKATDEQRATWDKRGIAIVRRFRDERHRPEEEGIRRINSLWAWFRIIKPAVFSKLPSANVERRFLDRDPTGRMSAQILERVLRNEMECCGYDTTINRCVQDYLIPGRGQAWVKYSPKFGKSVSLPHSTFSDMTDAYGKIKEDDESEETEKLEDTGEELITESVQLDYVPWQDFKWYPARARTWQEVQAVSKTVHLSKEECIEFFGEEIGEAIAPDGTLSTMDRTTNINTTIFQDQQDRKRTITEIWNKSDRTVYWVSEGYEYLCKEEDDPLKLTHFFPCPEPLSAEMTNDTMVPVPFYWEWQDQAIQLDELMQKMHSLTKALKAAGAYDARLTSLKRLAEESTDTELIPVENWSAIANIQGGSYDGAILWWPIKKVAEVLQITQETYQKRIEDLDRVTGITDVLRGTGDARETLGGQRLKSNASGTRVEDMRKDVGRFCRDCVRLMAEVIAKHFQPDTLIEASGILYEEDVLPSVPQPPQLAAPPQQLQLPAPPPQQQGQPPMGAPQTQLQPQSPMGAPPQQPQQNPMLQMMQAMEKVQKAISLLKNDVPRGYRIEIEVDTLVAGDHEVERESAIGFIQALTQFVEKAGPLAMAQPVFAPLAGKMLQFGVRKFRVGRDLESSIDEFADKIAKIQPQQHGPNPEQLKAQVEQQKAQAEIQKAQLEAQAQQANDQREQQRMQQEAAFEQMKMQMEMQKMRQEQELRTAEHAMKMEELRITHNQKMTQATSSHQLAMQKQQMQTPFGPGNA